MTSSTAPARQNGHLPNPIDPALLRPKQVCEVLSVSRAQLYKMMALGKFPRPLQRGSISYWPKEDVTEWIEQEVATARQAQELLA